MFRWCCGLGGSECHSLTEVLCSPVDDEIGPPDRNGEPAEMDWGCITMLALVAALAVVTAIIVLISVGSPGT